MFPIIGGAVTGPGISGHILPGGADFALRLPDGAYAIEARYCLMLDDGTPLMITNAGRMHPMPEQSSKPRQARMAGCRTRCCLAPLGQNPATRRGCLSSCGRP
jgi:hypothetical protein